jgi:hypothetical protein
MDRVFSLIDRYRLALLRILGKHQFSTSLAPVEPYPELVKLVELFNSGNPVPDVLYLGDSVVERISHNDFDKRNLGQIVAANLEGKLQVAYISHGAYHMGVFYGLICALEKMRGRPGIVVLPVNIRSFSPQWDLSPSYQFEREIQAIEDYIANPEGAIATIPIGKVVGIQSLFESFDATPINYPCTEFNHVGQFRKIIKSNPESEEQREFRLRQIFIFHYMHPLTTSHRKVVQLNNILHVLTNMGIAVLVYVAPINYQAGEKYVGNEFLSSLASNVKIVLDAIMPYTAASRVLFLDCNTMFASQYFFREDEATEHLNQTGRNALALIISEVVLQLSIATGKITQRLSSNKPSCSPGES